MAYSLHLFTLCFFPFVVILVDDYLHASAIIASSDARYKKLEPE
jgi:hypothetical protein